MVVVGLVSNCFQVLRVEGQHSLESLIDEAQTKYHCKYIELRQTCLGTPYEEGGKSGLLHLSHVNDLFRTEIAGWALTRNSGQEIPERSLQSCDRTSLL